MTMSWMRYSSSISKLNSADQPQTQCPRREWLNHTSNADHG